MVAPLVPPFAKRFMRPLVSSLLDAIRSGFSVRDLFRNNEVGVWYDPSDMTSMYQDAAGTLPVTAVEQPVGKILDKSGRGNHATQATAAKRPTLKQDANGRYYLLFDGIDDALYTSSIDFTATGKMTVAAGVRKLIDAAGIVLETSANYNNNNGAIILYTDTKVNFGESGAGGYGVSSSGYTAPVTHVISATADRAGTTGPTTLTRLGVNGLDNRASYTYLDYDAGNFGNYPLFVGSRGGTSLPFNGHLYSLIVRGAASTTAQIVSAETYVAGKTGISIP